MQQALRLFALKKNLLSCFKKESALSAMAVLAPHCRGYPGGVEA